MFPSVSPKQSFPALESEVLAYWKANNTFQKSIDSRPENNPYRFYDGPPFITGKPHYGSLLSSIVKDVVGRYWTMRGRRVDRTWGWDCHGLPIEEKVQKKLGLKSNKEIEENGVKKFIDECYNYTSEVSSEWNWYIDKIGRWVDMDNAYRTMGQNYMESVMWVFSELYKKGLIYEGKRVSLYSWKLGTPISNFEVAMDDTYQEVNDPAITVKFRPEFTYGSFAFIRNDEGKLLLGHHKKSGTWKIPGGKFESGETKEQCLEREVFEETGLKISHYAPLNTSVEFFEGVAYYGYAYTANVGNITNVDNPEVDKFHEWKFFSLDEVRAMKSEIAKYDHEALEVFLGEREPILEIKDFSILAWTTTPWTIPANMALAVRNDIDYVLIENTGEQYIVAKGRLETVFKGKGEYSVIREFKGSELVGLGYVPPFPEYYYQKNGDRNHRIYHADFITDTDGTGIGHEAPEFGEVDFQLAKKEGIHISNAMDEAGRYTAEIHDMEGVHYLDLENPENGANKINIERMKANNTLFKLEGITHRVPFCPRSGTPLMQKAQKSWFIDIESQKDKLIEANEQINWFPEYLKEGRFKKGIETAPDWCISRTRYWGAPMPVWRGEDGEMLVISSRDEIYEANKAYGQLEARDVDGKTVYYFKGGEYDGAEFNLHKPYIDAIKLQSPTTGQELTRIPEVLDVWMDSGSMPFAQMHYPFENKEAMQGSFPADFIAEYVGQLRAWFYVMHVLGVLLNPTNQEKPTPSFTNVITTGIVNGNDGRKMSKSFGNYPDPRMAIEKYGADPIRFYMLNSPLLSGGDMDFKEEGIMETIKGVMLPIWNTYSFFTTYANIDKWEDDDTEVWYSRHGESVSNTTGKMSDHTDDPELTTKGREQSKNAGKILLDQGKKFDVIIHTSRIRARDTAHIIGDKIGFMGEYILDERFAEQAAGEYAGMTIEEIARTGNIESIQNHPSIRKIYKNNSTENIEQFEERIIEAYQDILIKYKGKKILIVAHAGTSRPILSQYFGMGKEKAHYDTTIMNADPFRLMTTPLVNPLDQWILSKLQVLLSQVHNAMEGYDISHGCRAIIDYMDELTNWYVRLSRRRFWESGMTADKQSAYETLYTVLTEISKLLAPLMPFLSENIYQGLTGRESVHLEYITLANKHLVAKDLNRDMEICEHLVSLGLTLRSRKNIPVRQPLRAFMISQHVDEYYTNIIRDELNVKNIYYRDPESMASRICKPDARKIGPKYGKDVQKIITEAKNGKFSGPDEDGKVTVVYIADVTSHDESIAILQKNEYSIEYVAFEGVGDVIGGYGTVVALDTSITEELKLEGYARLIIRLIQDMRKEADYAVNNRIKLSISGEGSRDIVEQFGAMITNATLSTFAEINIPDLEKTELIDETFQIVIKVKR